MKKRMFAYRLYIIGLLGCILFFSLLNGVLYFGLQCKRERPRSIEDFCNMNISENIATSFCKGMKGWKRNIAKTMIGEEYFSMYETIWKGIECFPVAKDEKGIETFTFDNSWLAERTYGGKRQHEGCDIMSGINERGYFQIVSVSDGTVEKMGWLDKGGYRVGIRSDAGAYFYYAHLYDYAKNLQIGDKVKAGQIIGTMGDSGYGSEGTVGKFPVHLHFGVYLDIDGEEQSVNPYWILKYLESNSSAR